MLLLSTRVLPPPPHDADDGDAKIGHAQEQAEDLDGDGKGSFKLSSQADKYLGSAAGSVHEHASEADEADEADEAEEIKDNDVAGSINSQDSNSNSSTGATDGTTNAESEASHHCGSEAEEEEGSDDGGPRG